MFVHTALAPQPNHHSRAISGLISVLLLIFVQHGLPVHCRLYDRPDQSLLSVHNGVARSTERSECRRLSGLGEATNQKVIAVWKSLLNRIAVKLSKTYLNKTSFDFDKWCRENELRRSVQNHFSSAVKPPTKASAFYLKWSDTVTLLPMTAEMERYFSTRKTTKFHLVLSGDHNVVGANTAVRLIIIHGAFHVWRAIRTKIVHNLFIWIPIQFAVVFASVCVCGIVPVGGVVSMWLASRCRPIPQVYQSPWWWIFCSAWCDQTIVWLAFAWLIVVVSGVLLSPSQNADDSSSILWMWLEHDGCSFASHCMAIKTATTTSENTDTLRHHQPPRMHKSNWLLACYRAMRLFLVLDDVLHVLSLSLSLPHLLLHRHLAPCMAAFNVHKNTHNSWCVFLCMSHSAQHPVGISPTKLCHSLTLA